MEQRRKYNREFKAQAVRLCDREDVPISKASITLTAFIVPWIIVRQLNLRLIQPQRLSLI